LTHLSDNANGAFDVATGIWDVGTISEGEEIVLQIETTVTNTDAMSLTAQVQTAIQPDIDSTPGNNDPDEDDQDIDIPGVSFIDLEVSVAVNPNQVFSGEVVSWTITVTNNGPDNATGVMTLQPAFGMSE